MDKDRVHKLFKKDRFAEMCGMVVDDIQPGYAKTSMTVEERHLNGLDFCQGGVIFTLADFAFACAGNTRGAIAVSIENSISFLEGVKEGEFLVAEAREVSLHRKIAVYDMEVRSGEKLVAKMSGTVYRKDIKIDEE